MLSTRTCHRLAALTSVSLSVACTASNGSLAPDASPVVDAAPDAVAAGPLAATVLPARLPHPLAGQSAIVVNDAVYLFGGDTDTVMTDAIVRFDPQAGTAAEIDARLPAACKITSAVTDGSQVYLFGGFDGTNLMDTIVRFDPAAGTVETLVAKLPSPRGRTAAFFDGTAAYVIGGNLGSFAPTGYLDEIVRFDPATGEVALQPERMPEAVANRIGAVWDGNEAIIPGGMIEGGKTDRVVRYVPGMSPVTASAHLPFQGDGGAYALLGGKVYVLGGMTLSAFAVDTVLAYDPRTDEVADAGIVLPSARKGTAAATVGGVIYLFGGRTQDGLLDEIVAIGAGVGR